MTDLPQTAPYGSPAAPTALGAFGAPRSSAPRGLRLAIPVALAFGCLVVGGAASQGAPAGAAALLAVALTLVVLYQPRVGALCLVGVAPVVSGLQRGLPVPGLRLSELMIGGFAVLILLTADRTRATPWRAFDWAALAYVIGTFALGGVDTLGRGDSLSADDLGKLVGPLQFFLLYRAVVVALPAATDRRRAIDLVLIGSILISVLTLLQTIRFPGVHEAIVSLTGKDYSAKQQWSVARATGPFPHWTMLSGYMMAVVMLGVGLLLHGDPQRSRRLVLCATALASASLLATVTLAPILGTLVGVLALAWWARRLTKALVVLSVAGALLVAAFLPLLSARADEQFKIPATSRDTYSLIPHTITDRTGIWTEQYLPALSGRWLNGYGPQTPPEITWQYSESIYITMLMRGGLILLILYGALMWALGSSALRRSRRAGDAQAVARVLYLLVLLLAVIQVIVPYFTTNGLPHVLWALAGLMFAADRAGAGGRSGEPPPGERSATAWAPPPAAPVPRAALP
jgi:quinol-cytochrome oxidoreductase complex cytochrome b subunit